MGFLIVLARTVSLLLSILGYAMFARAILSFFPSMDNSPITALLVAITEPFIVPVRALLYHFNVGQNSPIDLSFSLTYLLIIIVQLFLPAV